ncbi:MAG TPA: phage tail tape measure protein [Planctomycetes bacterium]|nr:phage tail tape measure protein [Planctomycetota bacterium]
MSKDVNIHVKVKDTKSSKRKLDDVGKSTKNIGKNVKASGKKAGEGMRHLGDETKKTHSAFGKMTTALSGWAAKLVAVGSAIALVTKGIRDQIRAIQEHANIAAEQQKKLTELQFLGEFYKEHPQAREEVAAFAEYGARPFTEVAGAWYNLRSKAARLSPEQRQSIMQESLELGRTVPSAPLDTLVDMFSLYVKQTGATDINRVQNVLKQTITEAGGGMADVSKYMPQFLPIGMTGGLTGPETAGLWAHVTTQLSEPSIATTGLKTTFLGLRGKGSPESKKMLQQLGVSPGAGFFEQIAQLSEARRAGKLGLPQAQQIGGDEGAAVLLSMLGDPKGMLETISNVVRANTGRVDLARREIGELFGQDEFARLEERRRRLDVQIQNIKGGDIKALRWDVFLKDYERRMRAAGRSEAAISYQLLKYKLAAGVGAESGRIGILEPVWGEDEFPSAPLSPTIINDNSTNYYPRTGEPVGPRVTQD